jgi:hypothetical protein
MTGLGVGDCGGAAKWTGTVCAAMEWTGGAKYVGKCISKTAVLKKRFDIDLEGRKAYSPTREFFTLT